MMWSYAPKTEPGTLLCEIPIERKYLTINRNKYIIKITITENDYN